MKIIDARETQKQTNKQNKAKTEKNKENGSYSEKGEG